MAHAHRATSHLCYVVKLLYLLSSLLLLSVLHSPAVIVVEGVPTPKALATTAVFAGTRELLVSELKEREFEIRLLRKALVDLSVDDHVLDNVAVNGVGTGGGARSHVAGDDAMAEDGGAATSIAKPHGNADVPGTAAKMIRKESRSGKGGLSLAERLRSVEDKKAQDIGHATQASHAKPSGESLAELPHNSRPQPPGSPLVDGQLPTRQEPDDVELPSRLPVQMLAQPPPQPPGRPPGQLLVNRSNATSAGVLSAEVAAELAASKAAKDVVTGMESSIGRLATNHSERSKENIRILLEASGEVAQLKEAEIEQAEHLADELRKSREHEVELSNGLTATLTREAADLDSIQKSFGV